MKAQNVVFMSNVSRPWIFKNKLQVGSKWVNNNKSFSLHEKMQGDEKKT